MAGMVAGSTCCVVIGEPVDGTIWEGRVIGLKKLSTLGNPLNGFSYNLSTFYVYVHLRVHAINKIKVLLQIGDPGGNNGRALSKPQRLEIQKALPM